MVVRNEASSLVARAIVEPSVRSSGLPTCNDNDNVMIENVYIYKLKGLLSSLTGHINRSISLIETFSRTNGNTRNLLI